MASASRDKKGKTNLSVDISSLNFSNLKRISKLDDIDSINCDIEDHVSPIYSIEVNQKIITVGDIHGDLISLLVILFGAQLINNNLEWVGGNTFLIFTGDLLDDYRNSSSIDFMKQHPADEITIISFLADLNTQALITQGRVLLCLGNHELINIIENRYVYVSESTKKYFTENLSPREEQFRPNSILRQKLSCLFEPFILVNNKFFFCHAGLTSQFIEDINKHYKQGVMENLIQFSRDIKNIIISGCNADNGWIMKHMVRGDEGAFFWTRYYGKLNEGCSMFDDASKLLGLRDLILIKGHDTQDNIIESCKKKIYIIDTTISRSFLDKNKKNSEKLISDNMNYLEIQNDIFSMISVKLTESEKVYKEKIEQFIFGDTVVSKDVHDFSALKVADLRFLCKMKGLSTAGRKDELISRLLQDDTPDIDSDVVLGDGSNPVVESPSDS